MRLSISNIAWPAEADAAVAGLLHRHGLDAIDVAPGTLFPDLAAATPAEIAARRGWWADRGIEIVGMQALLYGTGAKPVRPARRSRRRCWPISARSAASPRASAPAGWSSARRATATAAASPTPTPPPPPPTFFRQLGDIAAPARLHSASSPTRPPTAPTS